MERVHKRLEVVPFVTVPCGWMRCVACRDFRTQPGRMWLGYGKGGEDLTIACPSCQGTGLVTRLKHIDARTGLEIDYERPGQTFVHAKTLPHGQLLFTPGGEDGPLHSMESVRSQGDVDHG